MEWRLWKSIRFPLCADSRSAMWSNRRRTQAVLYAAGGNGREDESNSSSEPAAWTSRNSRSENIGTAWTMAVRCGDEQVDSDHGIKGAAVPDGCHECSEPSTAGG